jgi:hypothetical protein
MATSDLSGRSVIGVALVPQNRLREDTPYYLLDGGYNSNILLGSF